MYFIICIIFSMKDIIFPDGKLSLSISDVITFIYTKNDSDVAYIGSLINNMIDTLLAEENINVKIEETHIELTIMPVIKRVTLIPIKSNDLVHYLMHQIKCMNENINKINNIVNHGVRIDCTNGANILIGSKSLEFIFTKEPKLSTSHINHTTIYFDITHEIVLSEQVSLVKSTTLTITCDCSENIIFSWENLPKTIQYIIINDKQTCDSFMKNIDNIDIIISEIEFKHFVIHEDVLDIMVLKWPKILFKCNGLKFNYEKIEL
jgi:hypothetical protein